MLLIMGCINDDTEWCKEIGYIMKCSSTAAT